jgi:hypothetical protein
MNGYMFPEYVVIPNPEASGFTIVAQILGCLANHAAGKEPVVGSNNRLAG